MLTQKTCFFAEFYSQFATFLHFLALLAQKMLKMTNLTSVWVAQHPIAGRNIQQKSKVLFSAAQREKIFIFGCLAGANFNFRPFGGLPSAAAE